MLALPVSRPGSRVRAFVAWALLLVVLGGCAQPIGVRKIDDKEWFRKESHSALDGPRASERTNRFIRQLAIDKKFASDREGAFHYMHEMLMLSRQRVIAFHLAEITFLEASRCKYNKEERTALLVASCEYAWAYLFDTELGAPPNPYDSTMRLACNFYNRAISKLIEDHDPSQSPFRDEEFVVSWSLGTTILTNGLLELPFPPLAFDTFLSAYRYEVTGLSNPARTFGIGTPCLAGYAPQKRDELPPEDKYMPGISQTLPVTTILRFEGTILERQEKGSTRHAVAEFYDSFNRSTIEINGNEVALETDLTTPFAYMISKSPKTSGFKAMLDPEAYMNSSGLYMIRPYDPDRIPLILVHGLMSSPMTWVPMVSELMSDTTLRENYQVWFFQYPTGFPIPYSASLLRASLQAIQNEFDPDGTNDKFNEAVIVGHSMGGLLSKMMVQSSGDRLWNSLTDAPYESLELSEDQQKLIESSLFFERLSFIDRAVFMSTPHRGSKIATNWIGRFGQSLVSVPDKITDTTTGIRSAITGKKGGIRYTSKVSKKVTGIGNLSPKSEILLEMDRWDFPEDLPYHSIIGNHLEAGVGEGGTDTVVPYWSSHLDGAQSELIIKSKHDAHKHQEAILEIRRILLLHLREKGIMAEDPFPTP